MTTEYDIKFGKNLRSLRMACKLTQDELSDKLSSKGCPLTRSEISGIETGKRQVYPHEIKALHDTLGVDYDKLMP